MVEDFVVLGKSPQIAKGGAKPLRIGKNAHLRCGTIVYGGTTIGDGFLTGDYAKIRENIVIGSNVAVGSNTIIERDSTVGNEVRIHSSCFIPEHTRIEDSVWIGPCVVITNVLHPPCPIFKREDLIERPRCLNGPTLKKFAVIGAGAIILPGTTIGERSLVGAGAVVRDDVPPECVVVGSPAKAIGKVTELECFPGYYQKGEIYSWRQ
jgi:acetyltransferase-like isoleucine patch superfamily enzyme